MKGGHWTSNPDTSLAGDSESRNLPLFTDVTTREVGTGNWKHADTGRPSGARHDILARRQHEDKPPHCEAQGCLSLLHGNVQQPWGEKMKRKSERRRAESRKKRCAVHSSSEAEPNSDIYIEITGKGVCRMHPVNFAHSWQMHESAHYRRNPSKNVVHWPLCVNVFDFFPCFCPLMATPSVPLMLLQRVLPRFTLAPCTWNLQQWAVLLGYLISEQGIAAELHLFVLWSRCEVRVHT